MTGLPDQRLASAFAPAYVIGQNFVEFLHQLGDIILYGIPDNSHINVPVSFLRFQDPYLS